MEKEKRKQNGTELSASHEAIEIKVFENEISIANQKHKKIENIQGERGHTRTDAFIKLNVKTCTASY